VKRQSRCPALQKTSGQSPKYNQIQSRINFIRLFYQEKNSSTSCWNLWGVTPACVKGYHKV